MTEPTNEELEAMADSLEPKAQELAGWLAGILLIPKEDRLKRDKIVRRLREMDGERIEGWARDRGFPHNKHTVWSFSKDKHGTTDETTATLILNPQEPTA